MDMKNCRICRSRKLQPVLSLGEQFLTARFMEVDDVSNIPYPTGLCLCGHCGLVQLDISMNEPTIYQHRYGHRSGHFETHRTHLHAYCDDILSRIPLKEGDIVLDVGSNDGTLLRHFPSILTRVGVEPGAQYQFSDCYEGLEVIPLYFSDTSFQERYQEKCKVVSSIDVLNGVPDPVHFAKEVGNILHDEGLWTCEQLYLPSMLQNHGLDSITHDRLCYFSLHQIKEIADRSHFVIVDASIRDINGGSIRVYLAKPESKTHKENKGLVQKILDQEAKLGLTDPNTFSDWKTRCDAQFAKLRCFLDAVRTSGKKVYGYGASNNGNCLLQCADLDQLLECVIDHGEKEGFVMASGLNIVSEKILRESPPAFLLVLPWYCEASVNDRLQDFLGGGGQLIYPFPEIHVVSNKPRVLITGSDGHIAHYYMKAFSSKYSFYGVSRSTNNPKQDVVRFTFDVNDEMAMEDVLRMVKPQRLIHLAGVREAGPLEIAKTNGMSVVALCDIIHRNKLPTRLFNASTCNMYRGLVSHTVRGDDLMKHDRDPCSMAKIFGHSMVNHYREHYMLPFSNGILFPTESRLNTSSLLSKLAKHAVEWKTTRKPLQVGQLGSYMNITHTEDVVHAIDTILDQEKGSSYVVCSDKSHRVEDLVVRLYWLFDIFLEKKGKTFVDMKTFLPVIMAEDELETGKVDTDLRGDASELRKLGWEPKLSLKEILSDVCCM